jgi:uncharacterized protein YcfJ
LEKIFVTFAAIEITYLQRSVLDMELTMKLNALLLSATLATASMFTVTAHADNSTRIAATSALGSVAGTAIGKQMGGNTGAMIGSAIGGAGGAAVSADRRDRTGAAIGGGLGGVGGYTVGKSMGGTTGGYVGSALGAAGGSVLGKKVSQDRHADQRKYKKHSKKYYRSHR